VKTSVGCSFVGMKLIVTLLSSTVYSIQRYVTSICFVLEMDVRSLAMSTTLWVTQKSDDPFWLGKLKINSDRSGGLDKTVDAKYLKQLHEILLRTGFVVFEDFLCLFQWKTLGCFRNWETMYMTYAISGRVQLEMCSRHPISLVYLIVCACLSLRPQSSSEWFQPTQEWMWEPSVLDWIFWKFLEHAPPEMRRFLHLSQLFGLIEWTWCFHSGSAGQASLHLWPDLLLIQKEPYYPQKRGTCPWGWPLNRDWSDAFSTCDFRWSHVNFFI